MGVDVFVFRNMNEHRKLLHVVLSIILLTRRKQIKMTLYNH